MRYLLALMVLTLAATASTAAAEVFRLNPTATVSIDCDAGGGDDAEIAAGYYEIHVSGETSTVCYAATCATGGMDRVRGNHGVSMIPAGSVSCRSAGGTGVVQFTPAVLVR